MGKYRAKTDDNQADIVRYLRANGAFVQSMASAGNGVPDLLVGYNGSWHVLEVKDGNKVPSKQKLTPKQAEWVLSVRNRAEVHVVRDGEEALRVVRGK